VAIAPDLGERYLDTIYQTNWLQAIYGQDVLSADGLSAGARPDPGSPNSQRHDLDMPLEACRQIALGSWS
jgi:hypothetical protein